MGSLQECRELVRDMFTDPACKQFTVERTKQIGAFPNRVFCWPKNGGKVGILVAGRSLRGADSAVSKGGIDYLAQAEAEGRITQGIVVLANGATVIAAASVADVAAIIKDVVPYCGMLGEYFWLNAEFKLPTNGRVATSDDEVF
jgi:hypothetical protein